MMRWLWVPVVFAQAVLSARGVAIDVRVAGARGDGVSMDTAAIQGAIDRVSAEGGGDVRVAAGRYRIGSLQLRDGVRLQLDAGAVLVGSTDLKDYTLGRLIYAEGAKGVVIEGAGEIDGGGEAFWEYKKSYAGPSWRGTAQFEYRALTQVRQFEKDAC